MLVALNRESIITPLFNKIWHNLWSAYCPEVQADKTNPTRMDGATLFPDSPAFASARSQTESLGAVRALINLGVDYVDSGISNEKYLWRVDRMQP